MTGDQKYYFLNWAKKNNETLNSIGGTTHVSELAIGPSFLGLDFPFDLMRIRLEPHSLASLSALGDLSSWQSQLSDNTTLLLSSSLGRLSVLRARMCWSVIMSLFQFFSEQLFSNTFLGSCLKYDINPFVRSTICWCNLDHYQTLTYSVGLDPGIALSYALIRRNYSDMLPLGVILSAPRELMLCFVLSLLHLPPATLIFSVLFITLMMTQLTQTTVLDFLASSCPMSPWKRIT